MGDVSGKNSLMNNHIIPKHDCDSINGDLSSGNVVINRHTIYQWDDWINFKDMDGDVEKGYVSIGYGYMNIHNVYQQNGLKKLINYNDKGAMKINANFQNGDVSSVIGLMNSNPLPKFK